MLTKEQVEARRAWIGASDMAAILGVNPRESAWDVWAEKTGQAEITFAGSDAADVGLLLEAKVLDMAQADLGTIIRPTEANPLQFELPGTMLKASLDGLRQNPKQPVDAKTSGLFSRLGPEWGDDDTDEVPASYIVQLHCQMMCLGEDVQRGYVAALLGGRGFKLYPIDRNEKVCKAIIAGAAKFWQHVVDRTPPPDSVPSAEVLKAVRRVPSKIIDLTEEQVPLVAAWLDAQKAAGEAEKRKKDAQAMVIAALGDAEAAHCGALGAVTFFEESRDGYEVKPYKFRQLRLRKKGL